MGSETNNEQQNDLTAPSQVKVRVLEVSKDALILENLLTGETVTWPMGALDTPVHVADELYLTLNAEAVPENQLNNAAPSATATAPISPAKSSPTKNDAQDLERRKFLESLIN